MEFRIMLGEQGYGYVQFYRWALDLRKVNVREVRCVECGDSFEPGRCVYKSQYKHNGYVCLPCARRLIEKYGPLGYIENIICNLQACHEMQGTWTAQEVNEALCQREPEPTAI